MFHSNETNPNMDIVRRFKELGGEYITVCSDAHRTEHLGRGIDDAMDMLLDVGYRYVTYYKDRKAVPVKIEYLK